MLNPDEMQPLYEMDEQASFRFDVFHDQPFCHVDEGSMAICHVVVNGRDRSAVSFLAGHDMAAVRDVMRNAFVSACALHGVTIPARMVSTLTTVKTPTPDDDFGEIEVYADERQKGIFESYYGSKLPEVLVRYGARSIEELTVAQYQAFERERNREN